MVALARSVAQWAPDVLLGHGQGAVVALMYAALCHAGGGAAGQERWARLKAVVLSEPRLGRAQ
eukprot:523865-Alexandrium_andersonii.AAC.1